MLDSHSLHTHPYLPVLIKESRQTNRVCHAIFLLNCDFSNPISQTTARRLCKCTDLVRAELDSTFISNTAVGEAALLLQFSNSRYAIDLFCKTNVSGSYSTLRRTLGQLTVNPFTLPEFDVAIGNNT